MKTLVVAAIGLAVVALANPAAGQMGAGSWRGRRPGVSPRRGRITSVRRAPSHRILFPAWRKE